MDNLRHEFPIFNKHPELVYLDSAATTHKPACVIDALTRFYAEDYATVHRTVYRSSLVATDQYNETRETVCRFLNASSSDEIVFTRGTTDALNLIASSLGSLVLKPGDEILITEMEHHSNLVPWQQIALGNNCSLFAVPIDDQYRLDLVALDLGDAEIVAVGMADIEAGHR